LFFEEFEVGQKYVQGPRIVTDEDLAWYTKFSGDGHSLRAGPGSANDAIFRVPVLQASYGAAVAAGLWRQIGVVDESVVCALEESWSFHCPIVVGDEITLTATIVRLALSADGQTGVLSRYNELTNASGVMVQSGTAKTLVRVGDSATRKTNRDVGTKAWAQALADYLHKSAAFTAAVASWDGTIGLRGGEHEIHLRVYRGRIIDVTSRAPHGSTFTFGAPDHVWAELLTAAEGQFERRLLSGKFESTGDQYEYLRLTKVLEIIFEAARALAADNRPLGLTA
jgi:acyl dehydratase